MSATATTVGKTDQAEGLRELFGHQTAKAYCLASTLDADCTALLGVGTANALANAGHRTLLIDEVPLSARRRLSGFAYPVRYDLGQVLSGFVGLGQALRQVNERLWYAIGTRVRKALDAHQAKPPVLCTRLQQARLEIDYTLIASCTPHPPSLALYADEVHRIVVADTGETSVMKALELLREFSVTSPTQAIPVLIVGGVTAAEGQTAFEYIDNAARSLLGIEVQSAGWIPASALSNSDATMMLPASLYRALAGAVRTMEFA